MGKIISFFGADYKVGTTQISQCCAEYIAQANPELEVLYISGDGGHGSDYFESVGETIDNIRPFLVESLIDIEELKRKAKFEDNLYVLGGKNTPKTSDYFTPEMIELLLSFAKEKFDLIIIDAGSRIEEGISLGSLFSSDQIYLVLNQTESSLRNYEWHSELYHQLGLEFSKFLINKFEKDSAFEIDYISERLLLDKLCISTIKKHKYGLDAELFYTSLIHVKPNKSFTKDICKISQGILEYARG